MKVYMGLTTADKTQRALRQAGARVLITYAWTRPGSWEFWLPGVPRPVDRLKPRGRPR